NTELLGHQLHGAEVDRAELALADAQRRQERGLALGVARAQRLELGLDLGREGAEGHLAGQRQDGHQRSSSPAITLSELMLATTSPIRGPSHMWGIDWNW